MSELHSESQLFNIYQPFTASTHCIRSGISPACPLWKSLGCISCTHKCSAVGYIMASRFSFFSDSDSQPLSDSCCLDQKPGMSWGLEIYTSSGPTTPYPKSSLEVISCQHCSIQMGRISFLNFVPSELIECCLVPSVSLRIVVWDWLFRSCAFDIHFTSSWGADLEKYFFVFLTGNNRYPWLTHYIFNLFI